MIDATRKPVTTAIVGLGHIAQQHLAAMRTIPSAQVAAVCDLSPATAEATADRFGLPQWYVDFDEMLNRTNPDVVHITTPPGSHTRLAKRALESGAHVIVEKPAAPSLPEVTDLLTLAAKQDRVLIEDYNYVFNPEVQQLRDLIDSGEFGEVSHVDLFLCVDLGDVEGGAAHDVATDCLDAGLVGDFLPHFASLAYVLIGEPVTVRTSWPSETDFRAMVQGDRATASIGFCPHAQPNAFWMRVYGSRMQMSLNLFEPHSVLRRQHPGPQPLTPLRNGLSDARQSRQAAWRGLARKLRGGAGPYEGLWSLLQRSYEALSTQSPVPVSPRDVRAVNGFVHQLASRENVA